MINFKCKVCLQQSIGLCLLLMSCWAQADKVVFIQGYLEAANQWQKSGITQQFNRAGWAYAGHYDFSQQGVEFKGTLEANKNQYISVGLPNEAPFQAQAYYLTAYLKQLRHSIGKEKLILIGHSAGGVLARLVMVKDPEINVDTLITLSSPHLGSDLAQLASMLGDTPITLFAPFFGANTINRSQALYKDLLPEHPGNFLYWLNRQAHPNARYVSIVRDPNQDDGGDLVVLAYSEDMNNVYALKGKAETLITLGDHSLSASDGVFLLQLISGKLKGLTLGQS